MGPEITIVGSFAVGLTMRAPKLPIFGETMLGSDFDMGPGGKGSNQAVGTARLGAHSALVAMIGTDKLAGIATDLYAAEAVDTTHLTVRGERATGVGFIILNEKGENFIILDMGANELMDAAAVGAAESRIAESAVVMAVLEVPVAAAARAMELGRKHGARTILNPAPARALPPEIFANVDYLTPNESELRILLDLPAHDSSSSRELAAELRKRGVRTVVVTLGRTGALILYTSQDSVLQLAAVLRAAYHSSYAPEFIASLPLAGIDGTLRSRMHSAPPGSARLKTGHLDGVSGIAGYVTGASGKVYVVVSLVNDEQFGGGVGDSVHAALVGWTQAAL